MSDEDNTHGAPPEEEGFEEAKTLGLERWVQFGFVAIAGATFFIGEKLLRFLYDWAAELGGRFGWFSLSAPDGTILAGVAAIAGILTGYLLYRNQNVKTFADEVAGELSKVTWPSRPETWRNTIVVIITSVIAAAFLGIFDAVWSTFTDFIYATT